MGITCKPIGKFEGILRKVENKAEQQRKESKIRKDNKKSIKK
jgi:hypothetical protein